MAGQPPFDPANHPEDPKDPQANRVPATTYAWMIPVITRIARRHGYAIGVHGSMGRDLDLIAVPWVETANTPQALLAELCRYLDGTLVETTKDAQHATRPHGRTCYNIIFPGAWHFIDISFMPLLAGVTGKDEG